MTDWYRVEESNVLARLETDPENGLDQAEAERRLAEHGLNELVERGVKNPWRILWEQLTALLVVILIIAAVVSIVLGEYIDAIAILLIVVLNAILGFTQEYQAEQAMAALKKMAVPMVKVHRNGHLTEVSARDLVAAPLGDSNQMEIGDFVLAVGNPLRRNLWRSCGSRSRPASICGGCAQSAAAEKPWPNWRWCGRQVTSIT